MGHHQKQDIGNHAEGLPALLPALDAIKYADIERIAKHLAGLFEAHPVFTPVRVILTASHSNRNFVIALLRYI